MELAYDFVSTPTDSLIPDAFVNSPEHFSTKLHDLTFQLKKKYGLTTAFLEQYLDHACQRSSMQVLTSRFLLPPGYMDEGEMEQYAVRHFENLKTYDDVKLERRTEVIKSVQELKAAIKAAEEQSEPKRVVQTLKNQMQELVESHTKYVNKVYDARRDLYKLTQFKPINAEEFHRDMHELSLLYIESKLKKLLPGLKW